MTARVVAPLAATAAVLVVAAGHRPRRGAVRAPSAAVAPVHDGRARFGPSARVGRLVRRRRGRPGDADVDADRRVGRVVLSAAALAFVEPALALLWTAAAAVWATARARRRRERAARVVADELPEVVGLLTLAVSSGLTIPLSVDVVADRGRGSVAAALGRASRDAARGRALADALDGIVSELGDQVRRLVRVLTGALRDGTPVLPALERLADDVRIERRRAAEERARRLTVRLLFPLVVCILPAFGLLTVVPLLAGALRDLSF